GRRAAVPEVEIDCGRNREHFWRFHQSALSQAGLRDLLRRLRGDQERVEEPVHTWNPLEALVRRDRAPRTRARPDDPADERIEGEAVELPHLGDTEAGPGERLPDAPFGDEILDELLVRPHAAERP